MSICEGCHAGCCRSFAVPVTGADILQIEQNSELTFWDFACRWADPNGQIVGNYAPHFHFADEPETPFAICLQHSASVQWPGTTKCQFLQEPQASQPGVSGGCSAARCGMYGLRPAACRVFPTRLHPSGQLAVIQPVPDATRQGHDAYQLCPRPWEPADLDVVSAVQNLRVAEFEMAFFHQIAERWNEAPRDWLLFPDFLRLVYRGRVIKHVGNEIEADWPATIPFTIPAATKAA